jgi:uncharacterized membrane protein YsdA (DUF1294 family)
MPPALWIAGLYLVMSAVAFAAHAIDKRRAARQRPRIRERTLHLLELAGGWPGAALGRRVFRHKTQKLSYRLAFAGIVALHVAAWIAAWRAGWF